MNSQRFLINTSRLLLVNSSQRNAKLVSLRLLNSPMMSSMFSVSNRQFHASPKEGDHVDESESHSDFKAKPKSNYDETQLNSMISKML